MLPSPQAMFWSIASGLGGFRMGQTGFLWLPRWPAILGLPTLWDKVQRRGLGKLLLVLSGPRDTSPQCLARCEPHSLCASLEQSSQMAL